MRYRNSSAEKKGPSFQHHDDQKRKKTEKKKEKRKKIDDKLRTVTGGKWEQQPQKKIKRFPTPED
jgi:hypothetical protein